MRDNQPVTQKRVNFSTTANLLSTTDPKGLLTYANDDFCRIAGFEEQELIGQPHNIVRHPDMPSEAFAMLWQRLQSGNSWMGLVKNRCKNGDHYWVKAYATPIRKNGSTAEMQSVRTTPCPESLARAEKLYQRLKSGQTPGFLQRKSPGLLAQGILGSAVALLVSGLVMSAFSDSLTTLWMGLLLGFVTISAILGYLLKPLQNVVSKAAQITDDPVAMHVFTGRNDEAGQLALALEALQTESNALVGRIRDDAGRLGQSNDRLVEQVRCSNQSIAEMTSQTDQVATAVNQMSATIQEVSNNCANAADAAQSAQQNSLQGQSLVQETASAIQGLSAEIQHASATISQLEKDSESINTIIDVIRSVAEQTNLLALNAAIEAARAGEQGRGFAVVADEVRTLATRTHESTEEITRMISQLQSGTQAAVRSMHAAESSTSASVDKANQAEEAIGDILQSVDAITNMSHQIATASEQQSAVAEEVSHNITMVADLSQRLSEGVVRTEQAGEEVQKLSGGLQSLATQFFEKNMRR
jgi:aerotaxis receptor